LEAEKEQEIMLLQEAEERQKQQKSLEQTVWDVIFGERTLNKVSLEVWDRIREIDALSFKIKHEVKSLPEF
jgi:hypothetical protein